ncbi:MAG: NAD-dependent epimerase/dehydratase family protein [Bacteroidales bacterium]|nr:NAD-dependent epimerase/dehydratase family protein [Bacteroidales bacterium]
MDSINFLGKTVLVTGGNGYLGSLLVKELQNHSANTVIIDRKMSGTANEYCVDIANRAELEKVIDKIQPDIVFHLAALLNRERSFEVYDEVHAANYTGTLNLLMSLKNTRCRKFIFTSTSEIYGANVSPFSEEMEPLPVSPYSITKVLAETLIKNYVRLNGFNYTILRLFNFYGNDMPRNFFIPEMLEALKKNLPFSMTKGEQARDFLHVDDVLEALLISALHPQADNEVFNVCSGKSLTLSDFVLECKTALHSTSTINFGAIPYRDNEVWNMVGNNTKITSQLGFAVKHSIQSFINQMMTVDYEQK